MPPAGKWCRSTRVKSTKPTECARLVDFAVGEFGRIDVLFNLAAKSHFSPIETFNGRRLERPLDETK